MFSIPARPCKVETHVFTPLSSTSLHLSRLQDSRRRRDRDGTYGSPIYPQKRPPIHVSTDSTTTRQNYVLRVTYAFRRPAYSVLCGWVLMPVLPGPPGARKSDIRPMCWRQHCPTAQLGAKENWGSSEPSHGSNALQTVGG